MSPTLVTASYLVAAVLFILSLSGLSGQGTARRANAYGIAGMLIAVALSALSQVHNVGVLAGGIAVGALVGSVLAARVAMTSMPELVAILHSFVGLAAVLVGVASYLGNSAPFPSRTEAVIHELEVYVGVFVG